MFVNNAESVNKHFDYIFSYFCYDLQAIGMHNCSSNSVVVVLFGHVCFRSRKSAPVFDPVCLQP